MQVKAKIAVMAVMLINSSIQAQEKPPFGINDFRAWNHNLQAAREFADNEYIYEAKVKQHADTLAGRIGESVEITLIVQSVQKGQVTFEVCDDVPLDEVPTKSRQYLPFVIVNKPTARRVVELEQPLIDAFPKDYLGRRLPASFEGQLRVGDLVPLELARTLRSGEILLLSGRIAGVVVGRYSSRHPLLLAVVINDAKVALHEPMNGLSVDPCP